MVATLVSPPSVQLDAQRAAARADIYTILAACFAPPTWELVAAATQGALADSISLALSALPLTWQPLGPALRQFEILPGRVTAASMEDATARADREYTRLFGGPDDGLVPLYESSYFDDEAGDAAGGALWSQTAFCVREGYAAAGLPVPVRVQPPDHLSAELEFVACLSDREARERANGYAAAADEAAHHRQAFMAEHLHRWAPAVARRTLAHAHHPLYVAAASLLWSVMEVDHS
jgi:TorA maturation chaperone TorD